MKRVIDRIADRFKPKKDIGLEEYNKLEYRK